MKIVCDRCGAITDENNKVELELYYSMAHSRNPNSTNIKYYICPTCAEFVREKIKYMVNEDVQLDTS